MHTQIIKIAELSDSNSVATLFDSLEQLSLASLNDNESEYLKKQLEKDDDCTLFKYPHVLFFSKIKADKEKHLQIEEARVAGAKLFDILKAGKIKTIQLENHSNSEFLPAFVEGLLLARYSFDKYKKEKEEYSLDEIKIVNEISDKQIEELISVTQAVFYARDLVNEPLSYLTATQFSEEIVQLGKESGFSVEVFNKQKIEALKMGGLLAVNKGSIDPPTFTILEWKPANATNSKPVILVGKGVVFDTGGLSLKPTAKSMDFMKSDMAGAAVVAATLYAVAKNNLPVHVLGLIPATDNRPDGNAYAPGDIITMFDGTTVEIMNTDAEGRLILADALSYAKKYSPELVIDIATLTGSAVSIASNHAIVGMGNTPEYIGKIKETGDETFERIINIPLWEEFAKLIDKQLSRLDS